MSHQHPSIKSADSILQVIWKKFTGDDRASFLFSTNIAEFACNFLALESLFKICFKVFHTLLQVWTGNILNFFILRDVPEQVSLTESREDHGPTLRVMLGHRLVHLVLVPSIVPFFWLSNFPGFDFGWFCPSVCFLSIWIPFLFTIPCRKSKQNSKQSWFQCLIRIERTDQGTLENETHRKLRNK
jgi:hypothetical protein